MAAMIILVSSLMILLVSSLHGSQAQIPSNITQGTTLTAGSDSAWLSPNGDFAFGFYRLEDNRFLVGIWFDKITNRTLVWSANRDDPVLPTGSTINLTSGGLLVDPNSDRNAYPIYSGSGASWAVMQNDGNFVLKDSFSRVLWQSFYHPTDTLLLGQVLVEGQKLFSNAEGTVDYSTGRFRLEMQRDGNLVLSAHHFTDSGYWYNNVVEPGNVSLVFNQSTAVMYLVNGTDILLSFTNTTKLPTPVEDYYHRATVDDYGNFQQYVYRKTNGREWTKVWSAVTIPCSVNAVCGMYGYCTSPNNETVTCACLPGFSPLDPKSLRKGCYPDVVPEQYCRDNPSLMNFTRVVFNDSDIKNEDFTDMARIESADLESCWKELLDDCYCTAATLVDSICYKKRMPFFNARENPPTTNQIRILIKVAKRTNDPSSREGEGKKNYHSLVVAGLLTSSVLAILFAAIAIYYHLVAQRYRPKKPSPDVGTVDINLRAFTFQELHDATNGLSNRLGQGAFGTVYSGIISLEGKMIEIAVKQLEKLIEQGEKEFITELKVIARTHHRNLVPLLGFCDEDNHRILVYDFMKNGSLSGFLFKEGKRPSWDLRVEIAFGIARGLLYLHEECETQIIHCDIKPQNVLLDENYTAKISDFGLAKLLINDQTHTKTDLRGTMGYMAPEWLRNVPITAKVDIYSFGVMLLEIICCRRHIELNRLEEETEGDELILTDWVISCMRSEKLEMVVMHDAEVLSDFKRFERMATVGLWCIHPDPILRPSMKKITQMLEGVIEVGVPPLMYAEAY